MAYKDKTQGNLYNNKYKATHYDRTLLLFPKGFKSEVMEAAQKSGKTMSVYVVEAIRTRMASEGFNLDIADQTPDQSPDQTQK